MLKLKLQYFGHLMRRADSLEKTLMLGKIGGRRRRGRQRMKVGWHHRFNGHGFGWTPGVGDGQGGLACCGSWSCRVGHDWVTELNWTFNLPTVKCRFYKSTAAVLTNAYSRMITQIKAQNISITPKSALCVPLKSIPLALQSDFYYCRLDLPFQKADINAHVLFQGSCRPV